MGYLRFFKRFRIAPGMSINLSKSGPSVSVGPRGLKATLGFSGKRFTAGIPGTGIYYTETEKKQYEDSGREVQGGFASSNQWGIVRCLFYFILAAFIVYISIQMFLL